MSETVLISPMTRRATKGVNFMPYGGYVDGPVASIEDLFGKTVDHETISVLMAYQKIGYFRAIIELRAAAVSGVPFTIRQDGAEDPIYDSDRDGDDFPDELEWSQDIQQYISLIEASEVMDGKAAVLKLMDHGIMTGLQWWEIGSWSPVIGKKGIETYKRKIQTETGGYEERPFSAQFVIPFWQRDPFVGIGPGNSLAMAALHDANVINSLNVYVKNALDSGLLRATIVGVPKGTLKEDRDHIEASWWQWFKGKFRAGRIKVVEAGAFTVENVGEGIKDLENIPLTQDARESMSTAMGVPHAIVMSNITGAKATTEQDDIKFYVYTVMPACKRHARQLNRYLYRPNGYTFQYEFDRLSILEQFQLNKAERLQKLVGGPIMEANEAREKLGLRPSKNLVSVAKPQRRQEEVEEEDQPLSGSAQDEIKKWRRKAAERGAGAPFKCYYIPEEVQSVIRMRLSNGESINSAFEPPYSDF